MTKIVKVDLYRANDWYQVYLGNIINQTIGIAEKSDFDLIKLFPKEFMENDIIMGTNILPSIPKL